MSARSALFIAAIALSAFSYAEEDADPAQVAIGERLFLETRFAQFFFAHCDGNVNTVLAKGDPVVENAQTTGSPMPGAFKGQSMNCRACHLVDEYATLADGGIRTYVDFARRSPIPDRGDGRTTTARNSPTLVSLIKPSNALFFHFDGEFITLPDLVEATLTGRNYGWLPGERKAAIKHIARVIRGDDGSGALAQGAGGAYSKVLTGTDDDIPDELRITEIMRVDVASATDGEILEAVKNLITAYVNSLKFSQDANGVFNGSPYDAFLRKNSLPAAPRNGEDDIAYARRLRDEIAKLSAPKFVDEADGKLLLHKQTFTFGALELKGLRIFLAEATGPSLLPQNSTGNCMACHAPPHFADFKFHNTGATQDEYDGIHGAEAFAKLDIPNLKARQANPNEFQHATARHPNATGRFQGVPSAAQPGVTDLGLWNVFANADNPKPQKRLLKMLKEQAGGRLSKSDALDRAIALFKTPGLRDLGQSPPYMHTGQFDSLEDVIRFYNKSSVLSRLGRIRNPAPELNGIGITDDDVAPLAAFLRSLNEDYQ